MRCMKHLSATAIGAALTMQAIPAGALSGNIHLTSCACTTTADFALAAKQRAIYIDQYGTTSPAGTYVIASTSQPRTAYMAVPAAT